MGDLANMVGADGRISADRLRRWLCDMAQMEYQKVGEAVDSEKPIRAAQHRGMWSVLLYMIADLEVALRKEEV
jgi:hypothetical protein